MKIIICGMKNTPERINRLDIAEEKVRELKDRTVEMI